MVLNKLEQQIVRQAVCKNPAHYELVAKYATDEKARDGNNCTLVTVDVQQAADRRKSIYQARFASKNSGIVYAAKVFQANVQSVTLQ